jgi:hypothetical protein
LIDPASHCSRPPRDRFVASWQCLTALGDVVKFGARPALLFKRRGRRKSSETPVVAALAM